MSFSRSVGFNQQTQNYSYQSLLKMLKANISEQYRCLAQILKCLVCKEMVSQAHSCPNCSKFYCLECIIHQLADEEKCLNCCGFLEVSMLVNCQKLCLDLTQTLAKVRERGEDPSNNVSQKSPLYCTRHCLQKTYYCQTCQRPLCSDCSVLTETHRGHQFIKLSIIRSAYEEKAGEKLDQIKAVRKNIEKRLQYAEGSNLKKGGSGADSLPKLQVAMRTLKENLSKNTKKIVIQGERCRNQISSLIKNLSQKYQDWMNILRNCSKGKFVEQEYSIIQKGLTSLLMNIQREYPKFDMIAAEIKAKNQHMSFINPEYQEYTFLIQNFQKKRKEGDFFYTNTIKTKQNLVWRLKIYPNGIIKNKQGQERKNQGNRLIKKQSRTEDYFAIFIQYMDGPVANTKQKHQISLISQMNQNKNFSRQFDSQFQLGECWGYQHYIKLSQLYDEDFINKDFDFIEIVMKICPSSYYQATLDQLALINQRKQVIKRKSLLIDKLQGWSSLKDICSTASLIDLQQIEKKMSSNSIL